MNEIFAVSVIAFFAFLLLRAFAEIASAPGKEKAEYTKHTVGVLEDIANDSNKTVYIVSFDADGEIYEAPVVESNAKDIGSDISVGAEVHLWYNEEDPLDCIISDKKDINKAYKAYGKLKSFSMKGILVSFAYMLVSLILAWISE